MNNVIIPVISASVFSRSIEIALTKNFDRDAAIIRTRKRLSNCENCKLYVKNHKTRITFYEVVNGVQKHLPANDERTYSMARRQYLECLLALLKINDPGNVKYIATLSKLKQLIHAFEIGKLDIARIVMTSSQYRWFNHDYRKKSISPDNNSNIGYQMTDNGTLVRSKSERMIGNACEAYGIPYHYEERFQIDVSSFVKGLEKSLVASGELRDSLFNYDGYTCVWNVPEGLRSMNNPGSIWRSYDDRTGKITIFNDFKFMLADGSIMLWEHEGLFTNFYYRFSSTERAAMLTYASGIPRDNLIFTYERDVNDTTQLDSFIEGKILPRLWF